MALVDTAGVQEVPESGLRIGRWKPEFLVDWEV
jgi:hypothetical protein